MDTTSNELPDVANQLHTPFFTRAQIFAFSVPPSPQILKKVKKGGEHDYIPHEYIRALLDRYIGPGRWEMQAELHSTDKEIITKTDYKTQKEYQQVAATANVNVTLVIHARDGSGKVLRYSAVGSNTQYAGLDKGYGSIIGNAISSADSIGLKRAATNLGKAFGFDLKSKLKPSDLPMSIQEIATMMNERQAAREQTARTAAPVQEQKTESLPAPQSNVRYMQEPGERTDTEPRNAASSPEPKREAQPANQQHSASRSRPEQAAATSQKGSKSNGSPDPSEEAKAATKPRPNRNPPVNSDDQQQASNQAANSAANEAAPVKNGNQPQGEADWELSIVPSKYDEWMRCIMTMARRVRAMTNEREIQNFVRRNQKLIQPLPCIPASNGQDERDFRKRWNTILYKRYNELGLTPPEDVQKALAKAA